MSNDKHTPTPWEVVEHKDRNETDIISDRNFIAQLKHYSDDDITFDRLVVINGKVKRVTDPIQSVGKANAARIVQCVNEYDGLIETIAALRAENDKLESVQTDLVFENQVYRGQIESLQSEKAELIEALRGMLDIVKESRGVDGFHANGDIAEWDEFHDVHTAQETLAKLETK